MKKENLFISLTIACLILMIPRLQAQSPQLLNYQGKLVNKDATPTSGTVAMFFSIYPDTSGINSLWSETHKQVVVNNGIFNVLLGSETLFPSDLFTASGDRFLGIQVGGDTEMRPLFRLTNVAYAIHANSAKSLSSTPVAARWYATNHAAPGPVNYQWGMEVFNTDPNSLSVTSDGAEIEVKRAGYYLVCVNVLQAGIESGASGCVRLTKNGGIISSSLGSGDSDQNCKHILTIIESFQVGDRISVICNDGRVYAHGGSPSWSSLEIYKLN